MKKIIELDDYFPTGEPTVQTVLTFNNDRSVDTSRVSKYASEALDYIKNVSPEPGKTIMLLNAMGAEETYGPNKNGDGFPARPVPARGKALTAKRKWFIEPGEELTNHYQSFETNPAHTFAHHANKDKAKASGVVKKAFWNPRMQRVELLVSVDNNKDPEWTKRAQDGEFVPVSMGTSIKYDVCARCGNQAPTRASYCDCIKYAMNQVDEHGFKNYVHNPSPNFFDISRVFRPADRTGYTLKKVANTYEVRLSADLGALAEDLAFKSGASQKLSDIEKVIRGEPVASSTLAPDEKSFIVKFKDHAANKLAASPFISIDKLNAYPLGEVLSAASANGVIFKDAEFIRLATTKLAGQQISLPTALVNKIAAASRFAVETFIDRPDLLNDIIVSGTLESQKVASELLEFFSVAREKRAYMGEMLYRRLVPEGTGLRQDSPATTDVLHAGPYQTTRGAALDAQDAVTKAHMKKVLGGSAMLLGGYKALTAFPALRKFKAPLAIGAGMLGAATLPHRRGGTIMTDEGVRIPDITEMAGKEASMESIVHLVEESTTPSNRLDFSRIKNAAHINIDSFAEILGSVIST